MQRTRWQNAVQTYVFNLFLIQLEPPPSHLAFLAGMELSYPRFTYVFYFSVITNSLQFQRTALSFQYQHYI